MIYYLTAPVLFVQGRRVIATTPKLPEAYGPATGAVPGAGPPLRIAVVGESTAAGVGAERHAEALPGSLAAEVLMRTGRAAAWSVHARTGYTAAKVRRRLLDGLAEAAPDVAVVAIGVNDLLASRPLARFERDVAGLVTGIRTAAGADVPVVLSGMPPMSRLPALPQPLRGILGRRGRAMDRRLARVARRLPAVRHLAFDLPPDSGRFFGADGFHPGPAGYRLWAEQCAPHVLDLAPSV